MAATPDGGGYWLTASDAAMDTIGDAGFFGSVHSLHLAAPGGRRPHRASQGPLVTAARNPAGLAPVWHPRHARQARLQAKAS